MSNLHRVVLASYTGLLLTLCSWYFVFDPPQYTFSTVLRVLYLAVLLLPLKSLLRRNPRVYLWSSYLMLVYFSHGVIETYANVEYRLFAVLELLFSIAYFVAATLCVQVARRQAH